MRVCVCVRVHSSHVAVLVCGGGGRESTLLQPFWDGKFFWPLKVNRAIFKIPSKSKSINSYES